VPRHRRPSGHKPPVDEVVQQRVGRLRIPNI
jgi:hypothetical protein